MSIFNSSMNILHMNALSCMPSTDDILKVLGEYKPLRTDDKYFYKRVSKRHKVKKHNKKLAKARRKKVRL